ncbi:DsbA family oxidoreductase [Flavobacterium ardleyense]
MKIEIWSDVMCPFCYIGKRNLENALEQFTESKEIEVVWKSYQLDAEMPQVAEESYIDYLVQRKRMPIDQVEQMLAGVTESAKQVGLTYNLDKSVLVNSLNAHKLLQFANTKGLGNELEERLFSAFFTEGKNIADLATLSQLGKEIGLDEAALQTAFTDDNYAYRIAQDIAEARHIGVQGVPFFGLDSRYGVSGAQPPAVLLENITTAFAEWRERNPKSVLKMTSEGPSCTPDGICE